MKVYLAFFRNNMRLTMRDRSVFIFNFLFIRDLIFGKWTDSAVND